MLYTHATNAAAITHVRALSRDGVHNCNVGCIVGRLGGFQEASLFRTRFENKDRFRDCLSPIPTSVITAETSVLYGMAALLEQDAYFGAAIISLSSAASGHPFEDCRVHFCRLQVAQQPVISLLVVHQLDPTLGQLTS